MPNNLSGSGLYEQVERVIRLEQEIQKKSKLDYGDKEAIEFNNLIQSLPTLFPKDLIEYQKFIIKNIFPEQRKIGKWEILDYIEENSIKIQKICSDSASFMIENVLKEIKKEIR